MIILYNNTVLSLALLLEYLTEVAITITYKPYLDNYYYLQFICKQSDIKQACVHRKCTNSSKSGTGMHIF